MGNQMQYFPNERIKIHFEPWELISKYLVISSSQSADLIFETRNIRIWRLRTRTDDFPLWEERLVGIQWKIIAKWIPTGYSEENNDK